MPTLPRAAGQWVTAYIDQSEISFIVIIKVINVEHSDNDSD